MQQCQSKTTTASPAFSLVLRAVQQPSHWEIKAFHWEEYRRLGNRDQRGNPGREGTEMGDSTLELGAL